MLDITGRSFGRWTVKGPAPKRGKHIVWECRCECGTEREVLGFSLKSGKSLNCGCGQKEAVAKAATKHGMWKHPAYGSWKNMCNRCLLPNATGYHLYGGRGITVPYQWYSFEGFWKDMGPTWFEGATLDREDTNGSYSPDNCRWATPKQQGNNRRSNRIIPTPKGPMNIMQASEAFGIGHNTITARIRYGWPDDELLLPVLKRTK